MEQKLEKLTNKDCARWVELAQLQKNIEKELSGYKARAKLQGGFATEDYAVTLTERVHKRLVGKERFIALWGEDYLIKSELLQEYSAIVIHCEPRMPISIQSVPLSESRVLQ